MKQTFLPKVSEAVRVNIRHRQWQHALLAMAAVVVFITVYMLILPAITMTGPTCGLEEHTHSDSCYELRLVCGLEETPEGDTAHVHGPACYEQQQVLTCGQEEGSGHTHTDACMGCVCGQEEGAGHTHTDACYADVTVEELTCTQEESAGHTHDASCYTVEEELTCGMSEGEGGHEHDDGCCDPETGELTCGMSEGEGGHEHDEGCYTQTETLTCTQEESAGHTHDASCYTQTVERQLVCGQEETEGHVHTDACMGYTCGQEESAGHTHTEACYTTQDVLICGESEGHTHTDACYEQVLVCQIPEHTHTEECYASGEEAPVEEIPEEDVPLGEYACGKEEHAHTQDCYDADGNLICALEEHAHDESCLAEEIPEYICGKEEHAHTEDCYDAGGNLICALEEHTHDETCLPVEQEPGAFPEELPEGYGEYEYEDADTGLSVLAYAPEGAFEEDVELQAQVLDQDSDAYADAQANLEDAGALDENTGMAALDISFRNADGDEVEPDPAAGPVYVRLDARALIPDGVDESTVAVQHHAETTDGGLFGTGLFAGTEVEVETVADSSGDTGEVTLTPSARPLAAPLSLPAETEEAPEEEAAQDETPAALDVEAKFAVDGFSTFTITWGQGDYNTSLTVYRINESGTGVGDEFVIDASNGAVSVQSIASANPVTGYTFERAVVANSAESALTNGTNITQIQYSTQSDSWQYYSNRWRSLSGQDQIYFIYSTTKDLIIDDSQLLSDGRLTASYSGSMTGEMVYLWERQEEGSNGWIEVERRAVTEVGGENQYNVAADGSWLNVTLDEGARATYRVTLVSADGEVLTPQSVSPEYKVPYYDALQNGSFEEPYGDGNEHFVGSGTEEVVWKTTGYNDKNGSRIELVGTNTIDWHGVNYCPTDDIYRTSLQCAELNADSAGALYQDVLTMPGSTMYWSLMHNGRTRNGEGDNGHVGYGGRYSEKNPASDTMYVLIMSTELAEIHGIDTQDDVQDVMNNLDNYPGASVTAITYRWYWTRESSSWPFVGGGDYVLHVYDETRDRWVSYTEDSDFRTVWQNHSGTYNVPDDQYLTRYFFVAGNTELDDNVGGGMPSFSVGNHIDNVHFSTEVPPAAPGTATLEIVKHITGDLTSSEYEALREDLSFTVQYGETEATISGNDSGWHWQGADGNYTGTYVISNITVPVNEKVSYSVTENKESAEVEGYILAATAAGSENLTVTGQLKDGETAEAEYTNDYTSSGADLTIVKNIYGLDREQVVKLVDGTYRQINPATENESGLRFDVDYFSTQDGAESDNYNDKDVFVGDWTFNASDTLDPDSGNFTSGGTWDGDIHIPEDEMIQQDEAAHYGSSSLTEKTATNGETYYQYTIIISDLELDDWYHVWETHVNVPGYQLTSDVETDAATTGTSQGHADFAAVLQLTGDTTVTFTNRYSQGQLDLTKNVTVSGQTDNTGTTAFEFEIRIPAKWADPAEYNTGKYPVTYTRVDESTVVHPNGDVTFVLESGTDYAKATIQLYAGETAHIMLPTGIKVIVTEPDHDGYSVNWEINDQNWVNSTGAENSVEVSIPTADERTVTCTNTTGAVLPSTGGPGVANILTLGTLLTLGAGALLLLQRRRKEGDAC